MNERSTRRDFLRTATTAGTALLLPNALLAAKKKSILLFTKSSGFEHAVVKVAPGKPSIMEAALRDLAPRN